MKKMKLQKLIFIIILITLTIIVLSKSVLAVTIGDYEFDTDDSGANTSAVQRISNKVLGVIQWVSILLGVIVIAVIGIKFMMGSVEEKSQYKKSMTPLVIGIIVVMGTTTITKTLFNLFNATGIDSIDVSSLTNEQIKNYYKKYNIQSDFFKELIKKIKEEEGYMGNTNLQIILGCYQSCDKIYGNINKKNLLNVYLDEYVEGKKVDTSNEEKKFEEIFNNVFDYFTTNTGTQILNNQMKSYDHWEIAIEAWNRGLVVREYTDDNFLGVK